MSEIIRIEDDFDLEKVRTSGQCFRVARQDGGWYRLIAGDKVLWMRKVGADDAPVGAVEADSMAGDAPTAGPGDYEVSCTKAEWDGFWHDYFDLDRDYAEIREACSGKSAFVDAAMEYGRGLRILSQDPWEMLVTFIISQRKSMPAIATSVESLCRHFGSEIECEPPADAGVVSASPEPIYTFPTPEQLARATDDELRECSLGYRAPYIAETTRQVISGDIDLDALGVLDDSALFEGLQCARGVGAKVANCVCLFGYGRMSQVPVDVWIARAIEEECAGKDPFEQFGPYAGIMQQYVFYYMTDRNRR